MSDAFWIKFGAVFLATFLLGGIAVDNFGKIPTEMEKCTARAMELMPIAYSDRVPQSVSKQGKAMLELEAIRVCSGGS